MNAAASGSEGAREVCGCTCVRAVGSMSVRVSPASSRQPERESGTGVGADPACSTARACRRANKEECVRVQQVRVHQT